MKYCAVIVENRFDVSKIVEDHKKFLPESWEVKVLQPNIKTIADYNKLLTSISFWESLLDYDRVLIFQHDSALLKKGIEKFKKWDYIGAPWKFQEHGGNGGLSLRNPKAMVECIKKQQWNPSLGNEDVYFCNLLVKMPEFKLADRNACRKFSCETIFQLGTLGYHAIEKYLTEDQVEKIKHQYE